MYENLGDLQDIFKKKKISLSGYIEQPPIEKLKVFATK